MSDFLWGAISVTCLAIGLRFFRFWKDTHDRFFVFFALAFLTLSSYWLLLEIFHPQRSETFHYFYLVRLVAFLLIIAGILDKNLARRHKRR